MAKINRNSFLYALCVLPGFVGLAGPALSQTPENANANTQPASAQPAPTQPSDEDMDTDELADLLNSSQQLKQSVTLKRTVDGKVVETEQRTVTYTRNEPILETEERGGMKDRLKAAFDGEALTRTEAFEEAKLDYVIADLDRDGLMTATEFAHLVKTWRENKAAKQAALAAEDGIADQRQDTLPEEAVAAPADATSEAYALQKFAFMAGAAQNMTLQDYIREYLLDFDSMDGDNDGLLSDNELMQFRALNRGEDFPM